MAKTNKKRNLSTLLTVVLLAVVAIGGMLAYLTADGGSKTNMFATGDIAISLNEDVAVLGDGGEVTVKDDIASYEGVMPGDYLRKEVTVENTGSTPTYVAVAVKLNNADLINAAIDEVYENKEGYTRDDVQAVYDNVFDGWGINYNPRPGAYGVNDARGVIDGTYGLPAHVLHVDFAKTTKGSTVISAGNWFTAGKEKPGQYWVDGPAEYDGYYTKDMKDYEICYTYYAYMPAGTSTTLFNGLNVPAYFDKNQLAMFDGLEINITAKAIQADNMGVETTYAGDSNGEAKTAFAVLAGNIKAEDLNVNNKAVPVSNDDELDAAIKDGETRLYLKSGTYIIPDSAQGKTLTIIGSENTVIATQHDGSYEGCDYSLDGSTVTFENITINTKSTTYTGYARLKATYKNCTINGTYTLYDNSTFENCKFNVTGDVYNIWTWGAPIAEFNNCTFNTSGKAILLYGGTNTKLHVNNCTFNDDNAYTDVNNKAAIEVGSDWSTDKKEIYANNVTVNGFDITNKGINTGTTLWGNKNSLPTDRLNVVVDGIDVY